MANESRKDGDESKALWGRLGYGWSWNNLSPYRYLITNKKHNLQHIITLFAKLIIHHRIHNHNIHNKNANKATYHNCFLLN